MIPDQKAPLGEDDKLPAGATGNASNPSPENVDSKSPVSNQLIDENAEKYLREIASIEDVPDARDQQDMDETFKKEKNQWH